jgi:hypothetical protein
MTQRNRRLGADVLAQLTMDTEPWLSCDECFRRVDVYVEQLLERRWDAMPQMAVHLRGCPACAEEATTLVLLAAEDAGVDPEPVLARLTGTAGH